MDKKKTILIIAGSSIGVAILSLLVLWIIATIKERSFFNGKPVNENNDEKSSVEKDTVKQRYPLCWGSDDRGISTRDRGVWAIQIIARRYGWSIGLDGIWGKATEGVVDKLRRLYYFNGNTRIQVFPFRQYITSHFSNTNANSKWEITLENYNKMAKTFKSIAGKGYHYYLAD
jgi:hypothetical protein